MQWKIEEHTEFSTKIEDDPVELLEAIKGLMHDTVRAVYPMSLIMDALSKLLNVRQQEDEQLLDFVKRFKQH